MPLATAIRLPENKTTLWTYCEPAVAQNIAVTLAVQDFVFGYKNQSPVVFLICHPSHLLLLPAHLISHAYKFVKVVIPHLERNIVVQINAPASGGCVVIRGRRAVVVGCGRGGRLRQVDRSNGRIFGISAII